MTIVIKTQSGSLIFNPCEIYIDSKLIKEEKYTIRAITPAESAWDSELGQYAPKERAQEIIDELYSLFVNFVYDERCNIIEWQMPEE